MRPPSCRPSRLSGCGVTQHEGRQPMIRHGMEKAPSNTEPLYLRVEKDAVRILRQHAVGKWGPGKFVARCIYEWEQRRQMREELAQAEAARASDAPSVP